MTAMRHNSFLGLSPAGFHRVAYTEWGDPANPRVLICAHGLTRNGRDFDFLAAALAADYRVLCPDMVGRGKSEWLSAKDHYSYPQYAADMTALIARSGAAQVDWVGTSMGGIIGMLLAAQPGSPVRRLVLNDVGSFIPRASLLRLANYVGKDPKFDTLEEFEQCVRVVSAPFGPLTDEQWRHLALHCHYVDAQGKLRFAYDPALDGVFKDVAQLQDVDLSPWWNQVQCPVLLIRGEQSDLLLPETVRHMQASRPGMLYAEIKETGHAPMLMDPSQIELVSGFLRDR